MRITVRYFAHIRELLERAEEVLELDAAVSSVDDLLAHLQARDAEAWQRLPEDWTVLAAVNHEMSQGSVRLQDGDEVGFFPPVTGG